jgi:hypothetical protein
MALGIRLCFVNTSEFRGGEGGLGVQLRYATAAASTKSECISVTSVLKLNTTLK